MTYIPHCRIVFRGEYANTQEEWSFSTKWQKDYGGFLMDINNIDASAMLTAMQTLFAQAGLFASYLRVTGWRAYDIGANGLMTGNPRIVEFTPAQVISGVGTYLNPPQTALCVTTGAPNRGPGRFGRFYLPAPSKAVSGDCRLPVSDQTAYANAVKAFLESVQNAIDIPDTFTPAKMVNASAIGSGFEQVITYIRVGRVYDTIRRRRSQLDENYLDLAVDVST